MRINIVLIFVVLFCVRGVSQKIDTSGKATFCEGNTVTLTVSPITGIAGYQWIKNNTDTLNEISASYTAFLSGSYKVKLKRGTLPDTTIGPVVVTVNPKPIINVNPSSFCFGLSTTLTATGANTYKWSPSTGLSSTTGETVTANHSATTLYTVIGTNLFGCLDTATATVTVNPNPVADFTFTPNACSGTNVVFTSAISSGTPGYTYAWDFGDGDISNAANPSHAFISLGCETQDFVVKLTVTDSRGCDHTITKIITIKQAPEVQVTDPQNPGRPFYNCDKDPSVANPNYTITVINTSPDSTCISTYSIDWGDGLTENNITFPLSHTYMKLGAFTLKVRALGNNGCSNTKNYVVANQKNPDIGIGTFGPTEGCTDLPVNIVLSSWPSNSPGTSYLLDYGDGTSKSFTHPINQALTNDTIIHPYSTTSCPDKPVYSIKITATNACRTKSFIGGDIVVKIKPKSNFTIPDSISCIGKSVCFNNKSISGYDVDCNNYNVTLWNFGDTLSGNDNTSGDLNPCHTYSIPGLYTVSLTDTNVCGPSTMIRTVCITMPPSPGFTLNSATGCIPFAVTATDTTNILNSCQSPKYFWSVVYTPSFCGSASAFTYINGTTETSANPSFNFTNPGTYTITQNVINACDTFKVSKIVTVKDKVVPTIITPPNACINETISPQPNFNCYSGNASYAWSFPGGSSDSSKDSIPGAISYNLAGDYIITLNVTNDCGTSTATQPIVINTVTPANAGPLQNICGNIVTMAANTPITGTGLWTKISGPDNFSITSPSSATTTITELISGTYIFRWTITNQTCVSDSDVTIIISTGASPAAAGPNQSLCLITSTDLSAAAPLIGTGTWTQSGGAAANIVTPSANTTTVTGLVPGTYRFQWTVTFSNCPATSDEMQVTVYDNPSTANAGTDQIICAATTSLGANTPAIGNGRWSQVGSLQNPANITDVTSPSSTVSGLIPGSYKFVWTITNGPCVSTMDTVEIDVTEVATPANAGADIRVCAVSTINLSANTPIVGTGIWTMVRGTAGAVITDYTSPNTSVTALAPGTYTFLWTITNGNCPPASDEVQVIIDENVTVALAGDSQNVCGTMVTMAANLPTVGIGSWSYVSGSPGYAINTPGSPTTTISGLIPGNYVFRWTITNGSCSSNADVTINISPGASIANAGADQELCLSTTTSLSGNNPSIGSGVWSYVSGNTGSLITSPHTPTTSVSGLIPGTYIFRYTISFSNCTPTADSVQVIVYENPSNANAGQDQTICAASTILAANTPTTGKGIWSEIGGPNTANIADPFSPSTAISSLVPGMYLLKWTIISGPCIVKQDTVEINVSAIATTANAGPDATFCAFSNVNLLANVPLTGAGFWSNINGPNTPLITNAGTNSTTATGLIPGKYTFRWTITNGVCPPSIDDVEIIIVDSLQNKITAPVNTMCAGQSIVIDGAIPSGGNGTYNYQWQQSTDENNWTDINGENSQGFSGILNVTTYLRRKVTSLPCENFSNVITIIVQPGISNNVISANDSICINTRANMITGTTPTGGDGIYTYIWQKSVNGGVVWNTLTGETGINHDPGVLTETTHYRRLVSTILCSGLQSAISNVVIITINPDSKATFVANKTISCAPFSLDPIINITAYPDRNLLYNWYADGNLFGSNITGIFPGYTIADFNDSVIIKLLTTNKFGCRPDSIEQQFITVRTAVAGFTKNTSGGCGPLVVTFNNTSDIINNNIQFFWNFGNGITSSLAHPGSVTFLQSPIFNDTTYQVTLKAYNGCDTTVSSDSIKIRSNPEVRFGVDTTSGCSPFTVRITNNSRGGPSTYYWDFGNGHKDTTFTTGLLSYTYNIGNVVDTFTIRLTAVNECATDTDTINIRIAPNTIRPQITINASELIGCTPHNVTFNNASIGATIFVWDFGDNTTPVTTHSSQLRVTHRFEKPGTFTIAIHMSNGCSDTTAYRQVTVFAKPKADFTTNASVYCLGDTIRINNKSLNANTYNWYWGDGQSSIDSAATHLYTTAGNYTVLLKAEKTDASGVVCFDSSVQIIRVLVKPDVTVQSNISTINCTPFKLNATTPGIINEAVTWYISDTAVSSTDIILRGAGIQYIFNKAGTFSVKMVAVNTSGCRDSTIKTFTVRGTPDAAFTPLNVTVCKIDTTITYSNVTTLDPLDPLTFRWLAEGLQQSAQGSFTRRYVAPANAILPITFTTQLLATNVVGCSDTATGILQMNPAAKAQFSINNPNNCVPFTVSLANASQYTTSYKWFLNGVLTDTTANPNILITQSLTPYTITLIAGNVYGCGTDTFSTTFVSRIKPVAAFALSDTLGCTGILNVLTRNQSSSATLYQWDWGDNSANSSFFNATHLYNVPGKYLVTLVASDGVCTDTTNRLVTVATKPIVNFSADDTLTCDTAKIHFTNLTSNADAYLWSFSDGTTSTASDPAKNFAPSQLRYTVKLVAYNDEGCRDSSIKSNLIFAMLPPVADFIINPSPVITVPDYTFTFNNIALNNNKYTYRWSLGDGTFASTRDVTHKYADTGSYTVMLIVMDTSTGCPDTTIKLAVINGNPGYLYVPNAFYPNTLRNEFKTFKPMGKGLADYRLQIFDSWGKLLFETRELDASGSPAIGWDGTNKGKPMPQDAYAWRIIAHFKSGKLWDGMSYDNRSGRKPGNTFGTLTLFR